MTTTLLRRRGTSSHSTAHRPCVLLVADEDAIRVILTRELYKRGFAVYSTGSGAEAVEMFCRSKIGIDLLLINAGRPGVGCSELVTALREVDPGVPCCLVNADTLPVAITLPNHDDATVHPKPLDSITTLCEQLRHLISHGNSESAADDGEAKL